MWETGHNAGWEAGADSPPPNMMYMPLWAISAETGTNRRDPRAGDHHDSVGDHGQRPRVRDVNDRCCGLQPVPAVARLRGGEHVGVGAARAGRPRRSRHSRERDVGGPV